MRAIAVNALRGSTVMHQVNTGPDVEVVEPESNAVAVNRRRQEVMPHLTWQDRLQEGGRRCRSDQEPSLTISSMAGTRPVTNG
jgi:hypothetical protein